IPAVNWPSRWAWTKRPPAKQPLKRKELAHVCQRTSRSPGDGPNDRSRKRPAGYDFEARFSRSRRRLKAARQRFVEGVRRAIARSEHDRAEGHGKNDLGAHRRDRPHALGATERDHASRRLPAIGGFVARAALPRR